MVPETLKHLELSNSSTVIDATIGLGGHAAAILKKWPTAKVIGFDRDPGALKLATQRLAEYGPRLVTIHGNYSDLATMVPVSDRPVDAILMDLGYSSWQLAERGFSFQTTAPLDLRMNPDDPESALDLIARLSETELADLIYQYGEERQSRRIARAIKGASREHIATTTGLAEVIAKAVPRRGRLHPATKTFQALRIAVNDELGSLERGLAAATEVLQPGGRLLVISFHSLEDRLVKQFINNSDVLEKVNKKVIKPTRDEVIANSRARSAKLRVARKTP